MSEITTRDRLINVAMEMFYQHGFHAVGLDRILREVGITKTAFYKHFESKDALILAALQRRDESELDEIREIMAARAGEGPKQQLMALFDTLDDWFAQTGFHGCMFINAAVEFPSPNDPAHQAAAAHSAHLFEVLRRVAANAGMSPAEADGLSQQLTILIAGAMIARHVTQGDEIAGSARRSAEVIIDRYLTAEPVAV